MLVSSEDLCRACNTKYASVRQLLKTHNIEPGERQLARTGGRPRKIDFITKEDAAYLLSCARFATPESIQWLSEKYGFKFGDPVNRKLVVREEASLFQAMQILCERYETGEVTAHLQYGMFGYHVDIALVTRFSVLCIEHDGPEHRYRGPQDRERQEDIARQHIDSRDKEDKEDKEVSDIWFYRCLQGEEMACVARVANLLNSITFLPGAQYATTNLAGFTLYNEEGFYAQDQLLGALSSDEESDEDW